MAPVPATDDAAGVWADEDGWAAFAPPLTAAGRPRPRVRRDPPPAPRRPVAPDPALEPRPAPPRPASRLAELFAEEDQDRQEPRAIPVTVRPETTRPNSPAAAVPPATAPVEEEPAEPIHHDPPAAPVWLGVARGVAAVLAAAAFAAASGRGSGGLLPEADPLPAAWAGPLLAFCGTGLALFVLRPSLPGPVRWGATVGAGSLAGLAAKGAVTAVLADGAVPSLPLQVAVSAGVVLAAVRLAPTATAPAGRAGLLAAAAGLAACGVGFPLADGALDPHPPKTRTPRIVAAAVAGWWPDRLAD